MKKLLPLLSAVILLASCNQYQKTPSGIAYKVSGNSKVKIKNGQIFKYHMEYRVPPKDSIFNTTFDHLPGFMMFDSARVTPHSYLELISKVGEGDEVTFSLSVDSLKKLGVLEYNNIFHRNDVIKGKMKIIKIYKGEEEANADYTKEIDLEKNRELAQLKKYVKEKGINAKELPSGVLVQIEKEGDGAKPDSGKTVQVMYKGYFTNGQVFDSNNEPNSPNKNPLTISVGAGNVIPGMDEGIRSFGKGGKGKIFVPAMMGYGMGGQPPIIPQYSNLIFDVEVVEMMATPPPPPTPAPQMPPMRR
jgi:FKBP-type peptidyl-prolyl cis-trans isomerase FkpA